MKYFFIFLIFITPIYSLTQDYSIQNITKDPILSSRCKELLKERVKKQRVQQKLNALVMRNRSLQKKTKPTQQVVKQRLVLSQTQLKNQLKLTNLQLSNMEENIIRKGCPGITL